MANAYKKKIYRNRVVPTVGGGGGGSLRSAVTFLYVSLLFPFQVWGLYYFISENTYTV